MIDRNDKVIQGTVSGGVITHTERVAHNNGFVVRASWTGAGIAGLAKLQIGTDGENWIDYPDSEVAIDSADDFSWEVTESLYPYVRIWLESTSGAITFEATWVEKRVSKIG